MLVFTKEEAFKLELLYNDIILGRCIPPSDKIILWRCLPEGREMYHKYVSDRLDGELINPHLFEALWNHYILDAHDIRNSSIYCDLGSDRICVVCGSRKKVTIDHKIPIRLGGQNHVSNLQYLCAKHNKEKSRRVYGINIFYKEN